MKNKHKSKKQYHTMKKTIGRRDPDANAQAKGHVWVIITLCIISASSLSHEVRDPKCILMHVLFLH